MSEKNSWGLMNIVAIIILGAILIIGGSLLGNQVSKKQAVSGVQSQFQPVVIKTITYDGQDGKTALEILKASHDVKSEDSSMGSFVTSIDGTENTTDTYWMFYVNDQLSSVSSDQYQSKSTDKIEWRYEQLQ